MSLFGLPTEKDAFYFLDVAFFVGERDSLSLVAWGNGVLGCGWRGYLWEDEGDCPECGLLYEAGHELLGIFIDVAD